MATCATCRHFEAGKWAGDFVVGDADDWEYVSDDRYGFCLAARAHYERVTDHRPFSPDEERPPFFPMDGSSYSAWLIVRNDFGCNRHEDGK